MHATHLTRSSTPPGFCVVHGHALQLGLVLLILSIMSLFCTSCICAVGEGLAVFLQNMQGEDGAVAGAVLAAAHRSNTPNRAGTQGAAAAVGTPPPAQNGNSAGAKPCTPPAQMAQTPSVTRRDPAAANRRLPAAPGGFTTAALSRALPEL
jgi:hypothetical protein